jgi:uncharacterized membrane protein
MWAHLPVKLGYLIRGFPGHPLHPPLTDATIGAYTVSAALGFLGWLGLAEDRLASGWWLALIVGLIVSAPTALTGLADWFGITRGTELWKSATAHMLAMLTATVFFGLAAIFGHGAYADGEVTGGSLFLTLLGYGTLTAGGYLGGTVVFVHGMRVLNLVEEPAERAVVPGGPEKERAET